jgi:predicted amino acid dehydrogenase
MKPVVGISLGASRHDFAFEATFLGQPMRVRRIGIDGDATAAARALAALKPRPAAVGLGVARANAALLAAVPSGVPATDGARLGGLLLEWAVRRAQSRLGRWFDNARVLFLDGRSQLKLAHALSEYSPNLTFADLPVHLGLPAMLESVESLGWYDQLAPWLPSWLSSRQLPDAVREPWQRFLIGRAMREASVVVAAAHQLDGFGIEELAGKTIVTTTVNDARLEHFRQAGVHLVIDAAPMLFGHALDPSLLDAMIVAATHRPPQAIHDDDYLAIIAEAGVEPRILRPNGERRINRFAFVIHPLSQEYFKQVEPIELLSRVSPPVLMDTLEKALAYAPPFIYSKVEGIRSPTGVQAEGWLISVGGTPREIMAHSPEFTYRRLLDAAALARRLGAQIMGLGAFTKVVGDAGVTVARRAPLPITTGNSYSASAALWAAHDALLRLGLVRRPRRGERARFKAMVVGATGSIGAACARLLVRAAREVHLVSPESAKLLALKESILQEVPDARLVLSANADRTLAQMDLVVTATSGAGKKVLDIMKVKPGCVITDVARPLDLAAEDVGRRPDVLVIESGEIRLPGEIRMKPIGLPPGVAYACLAETVVLALEGRFENFTVGRTIEWEKVREIYQLGLKHGMRLAAISGLGGVFSDADIARVREHALAARRATRRRRPTDRATAAATAR